MARVAAVICLTMRKRIVGSMVLEKANASNVAAAFRLVNERVNAHVSIHTYRCVCVCVCVSKYR